MDAVLLLVEPIPIGGPEAELIRRIKAESRPRRAGHQQDRHGGEGGCSPSGLLAAHDFAAIVPIISAKRNEGWTSCWACWPVPARGPSSSEDMVTDQPERQVCAEIIREKLLLCLDKEIPTAPP